MMKQILGVAACLWCVNAWAAEMLSMPITMVQMAQQSEAMRYVQGRIQGSEVVEYAVQAEQGQTLNIRLDSSHRSLYVNVLLPTSDTVLFNGAEQSKKQFEGVVQSSGEYRVQVYFTPAAAQRNERANYALSIKQSQAQAFQQTGEQLARNLIIFYDQQHGSAALLVAAQSYGANVIYQYHHLHGVAVSIPEGKDMQEAMRYFKGIKGVLQVSRDSILQLQAK